MNFAIKVLLFMLIIWFISMFVSCIKGTERQDAPYIMKMFIIMLGVVAHGTAVVVYQRLREKMEICV